MLAYLLHKLTGRLWWYEVIFEYRTKSGQPVWRSEERVGLISRSQILQTRSLKKHFIGKHLDAVKNMAFNRKELANGQLSLRTTCYLGWLKKKNTPTRLSETGDSLENFIHAYINVLQASGRPASTSGSK